MIKCWHVYHMGGQDYLAERDNGREIEHQSTHSHCLACAKSDVLARYGGKVDLRGWHKQGTCGAFLVSMQDAIDEEEAEKDGKDELVERVRVE